MIAIAKAQNVSSISEFIAAGYGKSQAVATLLALAALVGVLPDIALQLTAVGASFDILTTTHPDHPGTADAIWRDSAFAVAAAMAVFSIVFGVRHINAGEHHRGLMLAIACESLVKLAAFVGGLSAATGMIIVAAVSLSTMLCNDVAMPLLLRMGSLAPWTSSGDVSRVLLRIRRGAVIGVLLLAYLMHRVVDRDYSLTRIGLGSFVETPSSQALRRDRGTEWSIGSAARPKARPGEEAAAAARSGACRTAAAHGRRRLGKDVGTRSPASQRRARARRW
ncbi:hypothetical protein SAMN05428997_10651 [Bosea sp. CRIB-10]|uniref:hypothetical protein n=1 Tax=Bosea sp. CRIB-10 TaxID=378404 RepID=UPI0008EEFAA2|nr:hypothetical protein [Bosea sp. CRIB-10]SFC35560.1 hypothetical protein SAMN05428997_10651 [Bosea sp. CRIB-10]